MDHSTFARQYLEDIGNVLKKIDADALGKAIDVLQKVKAADGQVFIAGNGGSAATASHMANDLVKTVARGGGKGIRAMALTDQVSLFTAVANDISYEDIFSYPLNVYARAGDCLVVFSCSGTSPNILKAVKKAKDMKLSVIAFLGRDGGTVKGLADVSVVVPHTEYGPIEDLHLIFNHLVTASLAQPNA